MLPALNEQETVGAIVAAIRTRLVERHGLVDELVVMDSGSTDGTYDGRRRGRGQGGPARGGARPAEPCRGKGEVLWRSLAATTGDMLVFVDADLHDFTRSFVTGLLGPLLTDPSVQLVKATYDRPLTYGETVLPAGGGRVTELVARPLLNLHWPELAGFVQPLAGRVRGPPRRCWSSCRSRPATAWRSACSSTHCGWSGWTRWPRSTWPGASTATRRSASSAGWPSEILQVAFERLRREGRLDMPPRRPS